MPTLRINVCNKNQHELTWQEQHVSYLNCSTYITILNLQATDHHQVWQKVVGTFPCSYVEIIPVLIPFVPMYPCFSPVHRGRGTGNRWREGRPEGHHSSGGRGQRQPGSLYRDWHRRHQLLCLPRRGVKLYGGKNLENDWCLFLLPWGSICAVAFCPVPKQFCSATAQQYCGVGEDWRAC